MTEQVLESFKSLDTTQQTSLLKEILTKETKAALRKQKKNEYMKEYMVKYYHSHDEYATRVRERVLNTYKKKRDEKLQINN